MPLKDSKRRQKSPLLSEPMDWGIISFDSIFTHQEANGARTYMGGCLSIYVGDLDADSVNFQLRTYTSNTDAGNPPIPHQNKQHNQTVHGAGLGQERDLRGQDGPRHRRTCYTDIYTFMTALALDVGPPPPPPPPPLPLPLHCIHISDHRIIPWHGLPIERETRTHPHHNPTNTHHHTITPL